MKVLFLIVFFISTSAFAGGFIQPTYELLKYDDFSQTVSRPLGDNPIYDLIPKSTGGYVVASLGVFERDENLGAVRILSELHASRLSKIGSSIAFLSFNHFGVIPEKTINVSTILPLSVKDISPDRGGEFRHFKIVGNNAIVLFTENNILKKGVIIFNLQTGRTKVIWQPWDRLDVFNGDLYALSSEAQGVFKINTLDFSDVTKLHGYHQTNQPQGIKVNERGLFLMKGTGLYHRAWGSPEFSLVKHFARELKPSLAFWKSRPVVLFDSNDRTAQAYIGGVDDGSFSLLISILFPNGIHEFQIDGDHLVMVGEDLQLIDLISNRKVNFCVIDARWPSSGCQGFVGLHKKDNQYYLLGHSGLYVIDQDSLSKLLE